MYEPGKEPYPPIHATSANNLEPSRATEYLVLCAVMAVTDGTPSVRETDHAASNAPHLAESTQDRSGMSAGCEEKGPSPPEDGAVDSAQPPEKEEGQPGDGNGNELQKTRSQSEKMNRKQVLVIVAALCV